MRAVVLESYGGPEVLAIREVPDPVPGPEEILVDVTSSALNRADVLQRRGGYPGPKMAHEIPGLEFAGRVAALGERVERWSVGDAVMGIVGGGAHAERLTIHERQAMAVPDSISLADAGAIPEVFITAWDAMVLQGGLTAGRRVLVHAGGSGVGTAAIQLGRALGATVVTTASAGKLDACRALGAHVAVDRTEDWVAAVGEVDVVVDLVGGDYLAQNLQVIRVQGRIVVVGLVGGASTTIPLGALLFKRAAVIGTVLRSRPLEGKIAVTQRVEREVVPLLADGRCRPVIDSRYALDDVADAHRHMEADANVGKIVLAIGP